MVGATQWKLLLSPKDPLKIRFQEAETKPKFKIFIFTWSTCGNLRMKHSAKFYENSIIWSIYGDWLLHDGFLQLFLKNQKRIYFREKSVEYMLFFIIQERFKHRPTCFGTTEWIHLFFLINEDKISVSMETPRRLWRDWKFLESWLLLFLLLKLYISHFLLGLNALLSYQFVVDPCHRI